MHERSGASTPVTSENTIGTDYFQTLEHYIVGNADESGWFRGTVKAFGEDRGKYSLKLQLPSLLDKQGISRVGPFKIELAAAELVARSTTHSDADRAIFEQQRESFGGMFVYRNGVRVLPYGREDSDFFRIDARRGKHAGREFWAHRKFFGARLPYKRSKPSAQRQGRA